MSDVPLPPLGDLPRPASSPTDVELTSVLGEAHYRVSPLAPLLAAVVVELLAILLVLLVKL